MYLSIGGGGLAPAGELSLRARVGTGGLRFARWHQGGGTARWPDGTHGLAGAAFRPAAAGHRARRAGIVLSRVPADRRQGGASDQEDPAHRASHAGRGSRYWPVPPPGHEGPPGQRAHDSGLASGALAAGRGRSGYTSTARFGSAPGACFTVARLLVPPAHLSRSALDVGQGLRHLPRPDPQHVNTADMPIRPAVEPPDDDPVTRAEHLLNLKMRGWRTGEEYPARLKHRLPPNMAGPVGCRAGGLEYAVVGDQFTQGVEVPAVERLVELLNGVASLVIHPQ